MSTAWAIQGGKADPAAARSFAFMVTGGQYGGGVAEPDHLKVIADGTPVVKVRPGAGAALTRYNSSAAFETYTMAAQVQRSVNVPPSGSGGSQVHYVIIRIEDPQFGGQAPVGDDPEYWSAILVPTLTGINYPYIPLAKITVPPSTSNITSAMIQDLRELSVKRFEVEAIAVPPIGTLIVNRTDATWDRLAESPLIDVPEWATHAVIQSTYDGLKFYGGEFDGAINTYFAGQPSTSVPIREDPTGNETRSRGTSAQIEIPKNLRGGQSKISFHARRFSGPGVMAVYASGGSSFSATVYFKQKVE